MEWHSGKSAVSFGKSFLWLLLVWALAPFFVWFAVFSWRNANLAGGFAGRRGWCPCLFSGLSDLPTFMDFIGPCTNVFSTAYAHVRTEPQSNIGQTRGKKNVVIFVPGWFPLCTTAYAGKASKARTQELDRGQICSSHLVPRHNSHQGTSTKRRTRNTRTHAWPSAHDQRRGADHQRPAFFPSGGRTGQTRFTFPRDMAM